MILSKLGEAKRLHAMGYAVHWLRPNSKVPVETGWSGDNKDTIQSLIKKYVKGNNVGTKLGKPSKIGKNYLAVIDVDVKGSEKKHKKSAEAWIEETFPGLLATAPITLSGRGNGSMHIWLVVEKPMDSRALFQSSEEVEVFMPSVKSTARQIEVLGAKKVKEGWRLRPAFEIDFMCAGRQVVLPPSVHPDTGKEYKWGRPIEDASSLPLIDIDSILETLPERKRLSAGRPKGGTVTKQKIKDPDEMELETRLTPEVLSGIYDGENVEDRSAYCLTIALSMVRAKFKDSEILGVLTNREYFIGDVAFQHAKTTNRHRAARWAFDYCVRKARAEVDVSKDFDCEVVVYDTLTPEKAKKQLKEVVSDLGQVDWKKKLDRTDQDKVKPTFKNVKLIIENVVGQKTFVFDEFSRAQTYGLNTPWGGVLGEKIEDADEIKIKDWFSTSGFKFEPNTNLVAEVITQICTSNSFHPVREYLEGIEWDGVNRLDGWLQTYLGAEGDERYLSAVGRKFLVAAVARVYEPGKKFDHMPIFEGLQGIGKSTVGRILAGDKWFYDSELNMNDKDSALNLQGQWIVEMGELANINRQDVRVIKSFVVRQVDKVRPPYGKRMVEIARQCVFFGTTNDDNYLKDKTGNRRFWPVCIPKGAVIDLEGLKADRDQLWAEALNVYDLGEELFLDKEVEAIARGVQETRVIEDTSDVMIDKLQEWKEAIMKARKAYKISNGGKIKPLTFRLIDLFGDFSSEEHGVNITPPLKDYKFDNNLHLQLAAIALKRLGFENYRVGKGKKWRVEPKK